jgi:hypothetical protein
MIESFAADFAQDCEFERYVLSKATPIVVETGSARRAEIFLDGRQPAVNIALTPVTTSGRSSEQVIEDLGLRPLLFGAAWKVLDILVEYVLRTTMLQPRFTIKEKVFKASQGGVVFSPLDAHPEILLRVCTAYAKAEQYRHSLIHRRATAAANGDFIGVDANGQPLRPLSVLEQSAFCRMVQWVVGSVLAGDLPHRKLQRIGAEVETLGSLTILPNLGYMKAQQEIPAVTVHVASTDVVDMTVVKSEVYGIFSSESEVDVTFRVDDLADLRFFCELERAPDERLAFSDSTNLSWLLRL